MCAWQEAALDVQYLVAPGSADDIIWQTVNRKLQVVGNALDGHLAGTAIGDPTGNSLRIFSTLRHNFSAHCVHLLNPTKIASETKPRT